MSRKARLVIALAFAVIVGACSLESSRRSIKSAPYMMEGRTITLTHMKRAIKAIDIYQQRTGRLPASIDEVGRLKEPNDPTRSLDIVDSWNRPFIYRTRAGHAALISFGADGKPGGSWVDQDIDSDHPGAEVKLPYRDFVRLPTFPEILFWASVPAAIGFVLVFFGTKDDQRPSIATVIAIIFVGFTAVLLSGVMTLLDFYPDH